MKRSPAADAIIKEFEGYHKALPGGGCTSYADPAWGWDVATIGYGTTKYHVVGRFGRTAVRQGDILTHAEALAEMDAELDKFEPGLFAAISVPVTQSQYDSLCSFAYNCGLGAFQTSTLRRLLNQGDYAGAAAQFDSWVNANGRPLPGLVRRRNAEEALFRKDGMNPSKNPNVPAEPIKVPDAEEFPYKALVIPWKVTDDLLMIGDKSEDVFELHCALMGLQMLGKADMVTDVFNANTESAVKWFQRSSKLTEDGKVGPTTRAALESALTKIRAPKQPAPANGVATLRHVGQHSGSWAGLKSLRLQIGDESFSVASGARGVQNFRRPTDPRSVPGNLEPIPQGRYRIGSIEFSGARDSYEGSHGSGLGPVWVSIDAEFSDDRGAFGFHQDHNIDWAAGSAGCVVFRDVADLRRFVAALRKHRPKVLLVEWNL